MSIYQIARSGKVEYVAASSRKAAMIKKFGVSKGLAVEGVAIKKVGND